MTKAFAAVIAGLPSLLLIRMHPLIRRDLLVAVSDHAPARVGLSGMTGISGRPDLPDWRVPRPADCIELAGSPGSYSDCIPKWNGIGNSLHTISI